MNELVRKAKGWRFHRDYTNAWASFCLILELAEKIEQDEKRQKKFLADLKKWKWNDEDPDWVGHIEAFEAEQVKD